MIGGMFRYAFHLVASAAADAPKAAVSFLVFLVPVPGSLPAAAGGARS